MSEIQLYMSPKRRTNMLLSKQHDFLRTAALKAIVVDNGIILPARKSTTKLWADGGVLDNRSNFVKSSSNGLLFGGKYDFNSQEIIDSSETVIYFGPFVAHWGHFICDEISRLWYLKHCEKNPKIAYCGWNWGAENSDISGNYLELLTLLGCKKDQLLNIKHPTRFKKIIIPDLAFSGGNYYTHDFEHMINIIVKNAIKNASPVPPKIYFSRTKLDNDKERGEEKIEKIFAENNYQILHPETLSAKEQIVYLNQATEIVMIAGSISHSLMFAQSKNLHAIILNKASLVNSYQSVIDAVTKAHLTYIDACFSPRQVLFGLGPFLLSTNKYFKHFSKDQCLNIPPSARLTIPDIIWYFQKYHETYRIPANRALLKDDSVT